MKPLPFFVCFLLMTKPVIGGSSANYTLAPDAVDNGGLRATSASYTLNGSAMPGGAGSSADYTSRTGFAGQLQEPVAGSPVAMAITVTASPATVNEGATRQLNATLHFDDGSSTALAAGSIVWSVTSGPLTGISATGLASAAVVYQDSPAVARGTWQFFTAPLDLTVINTLPDNFRTYAGDGLPDAWQVQYFGIGNPLAGPSMDPDFDCWDNRFEYNACLIPTDPLSAFSMRISDVAGGGRQVAFSPRLAGCEYLLMGSSSLSLWEPVTGTITDTGTVRSILDSAGAGSRRFYFMRVRRQ